MERKKLLLLAGIILLAFSSCKDDDFVDLYERPDWLTGKVFSQMQAREELSTFARCVELVGYDTIIDVSGSYTVFAPNNAAFDKYFQENGYSSEEDIPSTELQQLVKYHIVQNPWSKRQLQQLDIYGWIDTLDVSNDSPRGFKRQTLLRGNDYFFGVDFNNRDGIKLLDSLQADSYRRVINETRKYAPIFFNEYFNIYDLQSSDYEFYFDRTMPSMSELYFAQGMLMGNEIFADNGFIYEIDNVVEPLQNAYEILKEESGEYQYTDFLKLIYDFPVFEYDEDATFDQVGVEQGLEVDSLFELDFPQLAFNITNESTQAPRGTFGLPNDVAVRYHHGLVAPTNEALANFLTQYLEGPGRWGSLDEAPENIKRIIVNTHMSPFSIYPTDFVRGFRNGESDRMVMDAANIVEKKYSSNCTFIGVDQALVPKAFESITGPIYLQRDFSIVMRAIEESGLLSAMKRENAQYSFYVEPDSKLRVDSSLLFTVERSRDYEDEYEFYAQQLAEPALNLPGEAVDLSVGDLRTLLLNHIGTERPTGMGRKEFIPNMAGNHIVINNETGEVRGTAATTFGFRGDELEPNFPVQVSTNAYNGETYSIDNWFDFTNNSLWVTISAYYPAFHQILIDAGLASTKEFRYTFVNENLKYTVFVPSDEALDALPVDSLSNEELRDILLTHFVTGDLIFTDGKLQPGYYTTSRIDESSTEFQRIFTEIYIEPQVDVINITDNQGGVYASAEEAPGITNRIATKDLSDPEDPPTLSILESFGVVHQIDKVLMLDELDTSY